MKAGWLNVTLTNYRNTDALDGVLGAARNTLLCPRCVPGLLEIFRFPCPFLSLEALGRAQPFQATLCCVLNNLSDFRWPPKYLNSRERHENRGWKSWVQTATPLPCQGNNDVQLLDFNGTDSPFLIR